MENLEKYLNNVNLDKISPILNEKIEKIIIEINEDNIEKNKLLNRSSNKVDLSKFNRDDIESLLFFFRNNLFTDSKYSEVALLILNNFPFQYQLLDKIYSSTKNPNLTPVMKILKGTNIKLGCGKVSKLDWENQSLKDYKESLNLFFEEKEFSLNKIYSFVESLERGIGIKNDILEFFIKILVIYDFESLIKILDEKKDLIEIIIFLEFLEEEKKVLLAQYSDNYLIKMEVIRGNQIRNQILKTNYLNIFKSIYNNSQKWDKFLNYYITSNNILFFELLGEIFKEFSLEKKKDIIDRLPLNNYITEQKLSCYGALVFEEPSVEIKKYIVDVYFKYIDKMETPNSNLIQNNLINVVVGCVRVLNINYEKVEKLIFELKEIENIWFKNTIEKKNFYYKHLSKLLVYSHNLGENNIQKRILKDVKEILDLSYLSDNVKEIQAIFDQVR